MRGVAVRPDDGVQMRGHVGRCTAACCCHPRFASLTPPAGGLASCQAARSPHGSCGVLPGTGGSAPHDALRSSGQIAAGGRHALRRAVVTARASRREHVRPHAMRGLSVRGPGRLHRARRRASDGTPLSKRGRDHCLPRAWRCPRRPVRSRIVRGAQGYWGDAVQGARRSFRRLGSGEVLAAAGCVWGGAGGGWFRGAISSRNTTASVHGCIRVGEASRFGCKKRQSWLTDRARRSRRRIVAVGVRCRVIADPIRDDSRRAHDSWMILSADLDLTLDPNSR